MKIRRMKTEAIKQKLQELRSASAPSVAGQASPAVKGDESTSVFAQHLCRELSLRGLRGSEL